MSDTPNDDTPEVPDRPAPDTSPARPWSPATDANRIADPAEAAPKPARAKPRAEIGRASCRERV